MTANSINCMNQWRRKDSGCSSIGYYTFQP